MEFVISFIFIFSWLVIRHYKFSGDLERVQNLIKPIVIVMIYSCTDLGYAVTNGISNPSVAINLFIWGRIAYNYDTFDPRTGETLSEWDYKQYGRYMFVYLVAPFAAAIFAGLLAKYHSAKEQTRFGESEGKVAGDTLK